MCKYRAQIDHDQNDLKILLNNQQELVRLSNEMNEKIQTGLNQIESNNVREINKILQSSLKTLINKINGEKYQQIVNNLQCMIVNYDQLKNLAENDYKQLCSTLEHHENEVKAYLLNNLKRLNDIHINEMKIKDRNFKAEAESKEFITNAMNYLSKALEVQTDTNQLATMSERMINEQQQENESFLKQLNTSLIECKQQCFSTTTDIVNKSNTLLLKTEGVISEINENNEILRQTAAANTQMFHDKINQIHVKVNEINQLSAQQFDTIDHIEKGDNQIQLLCTGCNDTHLNMWSSNKEEIISANSDFSIQMHNSVDNLNGQVKKFINNDIQLTYKETGQTPIRKNLNYPKYLIATPPSKEILLEQFRRRRHLELAQSQENSEIIPKPCNETKPVATSSPNLSLQLPSTSSISNSDIESNSSRSDQCDFENATSSSASELLLKENQNIQVKDVSKLICPNTSERKILTPKN